MVGGQNIALGGGARKNFPDLNSILDLECVSDNKNEFLI